MKKRSAARTEQGMPRCADRVGFTLVEILTVLVIISILAGLAIPSVNKVLRSANLSASGGQLKDQCLLALQTALSKNTPVELRLYKLPGYNSSPTAAPDVYRAYQLFQIGDTTEALAGADFFKAPVIISPGTNESALLAEETMPSSPHRLIVPSTGDPSLGTFGKNYQYVAFRFLPSGATDLTSSNNFLTLVLQGDKGYAQGGNFYTVQIDPINGAARTFRP